MTDKIKFATAATVYSKTEGLDLTGDPVTLPNATVFVATAREFPGREVFCRVTGPTVPGGDYFITAEAVDGTDSVSTASPYTNGYMGAMQACGAAVRRVAEAEENRRDSLIAALGRNVSGRPSGARFVYDGGHHAEVYRTAEAMAEDAAERGEISDDEAAGAFHVAWESRDEDTEDHLFSSLVEHYARDIFRNSMD